MDALLCGRRALPLFLATFVAVVAAWAAPTARADVPPVTVSVPAGVAGFSCNGEAFATEGDIVVTVKTTTSASGNFHMTTTVSYKAVTGRTPTGKRFSSDFTTMSEVTLAPATENTTVVSGRFIVSGESGVLPDDFFLHSTFHATVSASGIPSVTVSNMRAGCQ